MSRAPGLPKMSFLLSNFLGGVSANSGDSYSNGEKQFIIEKLTAKMIDSAHLEDRKAAAQTIKSLAQSHRLEIGTLALQALLDELKRDVEDEELAKIILETLDILCSSNSNGNNTDGHDKQKEKPNDASNGIEVQFCEILLKNEQNVTLLLDIMGDSNDFYLRFTSIQVLMSLCSSQPFQMKSAVLNSLSGVSKVLDLLKDTREIVRNEGLLFCGSLVRGNADLQKILGFQGAFEQVMQIIVEEEGPWTGPLIIQDAFNLISGLLNLNTSNQMYFRDSVSFKQLAGLISMPAPNTTDTLWNRTRISNYLAALSVLDGLLCKSNVDLEASQNSALKTHFLKPLLALAFTPKVPLEVSASAFNCLSGLIWSNNRAQQEFAKDKLTQNPLSSVCFKVDLPISPLMGAVLIVTHSSIQTQDGWFQRFKALELVEAFCSNNSEGQLILLSTLKSSAGSSPSPGSVILEALLDLDSSRKKDPWHCWFASALLCHLIDGNEGAKRMLLKQSFDADDEGASDDVLTTLMLSLIRSGRDSPGSACKKSIIGYLQLILIWLHEFPEAVNRFLQEGSFVQYLIERITHQSFTQDTQIQGLSALILGICVLFNDESVKNFGSEGLKGIIKNRIGPDLFISKLSHLKSDNDKVIYELISDILLKNYDNLINLVARPTPAGTKASHTATLAQSTKDLAECRALLTSTQSHLSQNVHLAETLKIGITERDAYILQLQKLISEKNYKIAQMAHEMSNLEHQQGQVQLKQTGSDQMAFENLQETIRSFQDTVTRQQARIQELEALLAGENNKSDSELEKWKKAYDKLYEQVQNQLNFNINEIRPVAGENKAESVCVPRDDEFITVSSAFCSTENITVTAAFCPEELHDQGSSAAAVVSLDQLQISSDSNSNIEVYSPSMFMSPLPLTESEQIVVISESEHSHFSPELVTLNQLPSELVAASDYPELKEPLNTSFTAAVIVSEEFAKNHPNPEDEPVIQSISAECPPDNFLASDEDVEIVSREELRNVLDFFDKLPDPAAKSIISSKSDIRSIQEGIDHLHVTQPTTIGSNSEQSNNSYDQFEVGTLPAHEMDNSSGFSQHDDIISCKETEMNMHSYEDSQVSSQENYDDSQQLESDKIEQNSGETELSAFDQPHTESIDYQQEEYSNEHQESWQKYPKAQEYAEEYSQQDDKIERTEEATSFNNFDYGQQVQEQVEDYFGNVDGQSQSYDNNVTIEQSYEHSKAIEQSYEHSKAIEQSYFNTGGVYEQSYDFAHPSYENQYGQQAEKVDKVYSSTEHQDQPALYDNYEQPPQYNDQSQEQHHNGYDSNTNDYDQQAYEQVQSYAESDPQTYIYEPEALQTEGHADQTLSYDQQVYTDHIEGAESELQNYNQHHQIEAYAEQSQIYSESEPQNYDDQQAYTEQTEAYVEQPNFYPENVDQNYEHQAQGLPQEAQAYIEGNQSYAQAYNQEIPLPQSQDYIESAQAYTDSASQAYDQGEQPYYYYYDEATGYTYGFDQNVNQYYYYDPNTGEYTYYTASDIDNDSNSAAVLEEVEEDSSASSNPSLFDNTGPPMIPLQQNQPSLLTTNSFVAGQDSQQVYNL